MSNPVLETIALVQKQIEAAEADLIQKKQMVNSLCALVPQPPLYNDTALAPKRSSGSVRPDEYYGQALATAVRSILERRKLADFGPATVNEIYDSLIEGGYKFTTNNEDYAKRGLYSALSKNSVTFHKLPNGSYGLLEWYPGVKPAKPAKSAGIPETLEEAAAREAAADAATESDEMADETAVEAVKK